MRRPPTPATFVALFLVASVVLPPGFAGAADWPQHLGPRRDGTSLEPAPPPWTQEGPEILWRKEVGQGFSAPVVVGRRLLLFHRSQNLERLDCLDRADGSLQWSYQYPTAYRDDFGFDEGPRAAPAVSGGSVFVYGAQGVLSAVDLDSGRKQWSVATQPTFRVRKGFFGTAPSPLVHEGKVFLNVGGADAGLVAFDAGNGKTLWTATDHEASYSSAIAATLGGRSRIVFFSREGLVVADPANGALQLSYSWRARMRASVNAATPLVFGERIFLSASYQTGAVLLAIDDDSATPVWRSDDVLSNHYATSVHYEGHLYGFHGRQEYGPSLRCVNLDTGAVEWSVERFGAGTLTRVQDRLLILHEDGRLLLAVAAPAGFEILAAATLLRPVVRAYPAFSDGILYARNESELVAARLRR